MLATRQPQHAYDVVIAAPNAAVDSYYVLPCLTLGDVNRSSEVWHTAGGKGHNAARALRLLGGQPLSLGIAGGRWGEFLCDELAREDIAAALVWSGGAMRHNFTIAATDQRQTTVLLEAGRPVDEDVREQFTQKILSCAPQAPFLALTGSLPPGFPSNYYAEVIARLRGDCPDFRGDHAQYGRENGTVPFDATTPLRGRSVKVCVDSSGETLRLATEAGAHILKVNLREFQSAFGAEAAGGRSLATVFERLAAHGLELLTVTDGQRGAYILSSDGQLLRVTTPLQSWVSTAGAGDTFMSAMLLALGRGEPLSEAARYASAAAAACLQQVGCGVLTLADLQRFLACTVVEPFGGEVG
jgi:1-phosphofructokinase